MNDTALATPRVPPSLRATACIREGWALIRRRYWLFLGITLVGMFIGSLAPFGILMGTMLCGTYCCFLKLERNEPVGFGDLFKGFDTFSQSLMAIAIILALTLPLMILFAVGMFVGLLVMAQTESLGGGVAIMVASYIVMLILSCLVGLFTMFAFPLIAEHKIGGWSAIVRSYQVARHEAWQLVLLMLLLGLLTCLGMIVCLVGTFFVMPVIFSASFVAYRKLFPREHTIGQNQDAYSAKSFP
jgi:hypothetical protein